MFTPAVAVLYPIVSGQRFDAIEGWSPSRTGGTTTVGASMPPAGNVVPPGGASAWWTSTANWAPMGRPFGPAVALGRWVTKAVARRGAAPNDRLEEIFNSLAGSIGWLLNARFGYGGHEVTYHGNPSVGSAELGHAFRQVVVEDCLALVERVVRGEQRAEEVRSIASEPAIIQPYFWRRLGLGTAAVLALAVLLGRRLGS
jgi:hypothetical protein